MKRKVAWTVAVAGLLVLAADATCALGNLRFGHESMPAVVGNRHPATPWGPRPRVVQPPREQYRVGVLGDGQKGLANLANIIRAVKAEGVDFILQTGDLVSTNDEGHYRLAALTLRRADLRVPLYVVPGNHDLKGGSERFEREIGPLEVQFPWARVTYVIVNNASGDPPDLGRLDEILGKVEARHAVVLAMHVPPFDLQGEVQKGYEPFVAWLGKSRVKYLLCGHVHGYFKKVVGGTTVIVNGVGGDYDRWQFDQKVYATILEVDGTTITDRAIELPPEHGFQENLEHLAIGHVVEAYRRRPLLVWGATFLVAALVGVSIGVIRQPRPRVYGRIEAERASPAP
jgi:3',5'-cyclic AMP phosphodiesterase CpdA